MDAYNKFNWYIKNSNIKRALIQAKKLHYKMALLKKCRAMLISFL